MNVNGILAAQRPGAGLAGLPGGCSPAGPLRRLPAAPGAAGGSQSLAGKGLPIARRAPGSRVSVDRSLRPA